LFSSLVKRNYKDLKIIGDAAESWDYKNKVYTFQLRPNLSFADGTKVTADDVLFSFKEFQKEDNPYKGSLESIEKIEAKYDDKDRYVKILVKNFSATLLGNLSVVFILPKHLVEKYGQDFSQHAVGSGPYKLISQSTNEINLTARTDHPYLHPKTPNLTFKIVRDDYTRFLKVYKGEIDIVQSDLPAARIETLEKKGGFQIYKYPGLSMTYVLINHKDPILAKLKAREALSDAINRDEIIKYKLENLAQPATALITPINPYFNSELKSPVFDLERARKTVRDLGLEGKELTLKTSNLASVIENAKVLANEWEQAGLKIKLQSYEWGTFFGDIKSGNFQLATLKWVGNVDPDIYRLSLDSKQTPENSGRNRGHYSNPALDKLLEAGLLIEDENKRVAHYMQVQKIVLDDLAIIPLWYEKEVAVVHNRIKDYTPPLDGSFSPLIDVRKE
jgi:peptide/nickel transport system substrate-binding protein